MPSKRWRIEPLKQRFQQCSRQHAWSPPDVCLSTKQGNIEVTLYSTKHCTIRSTIIIVMWSVLILRLLSKQFFVYVLFGSWDDHLVAVLSFSCVYILADYSVATVLCNNFVVLACYFMFYYLWNWLNGLPCRSMFYSILLSVICFRDSYCYQFVI